MPLRVVGAGLGRTGTLSLKIALERLLGGSCYHMLEVFPRPDHVAVWHAAVKGDLPDWDALYDGFRSAVDWPTAAFYRELADAYPESVVMLSVRDSESWWRSADQTIFEVFRGRLREDGAAAGPWLDMVTDLLRVRFTEDSSTATRRSRLTSAITTRSAGGFRRSASSSGSPATAGTRSAGHSTCPFPKSPSHTRTRPTSSGRARASIRNVGRR